MRILITGCTSSQVGGNPRYRYATQAPIYERVLSGLGHEVDRRPVEPGENLDGYHRVIVFVAPGIDVWSIYQLGAWYALDARPDAFLAYEDWQVAKIAGAARTQRDRPRYLWGSSVAQQRRFFDVARKHHQEAIERTVELLALAGEVPWRLIVSVHGYGNAKLLEPILPQARRVYALDPTSALHAQGIKKSSLRERAWVLAALGSRERWVKAQRLTWKIIKFGHGGLRVANEMEIVREYARCWGVLAPEYPDPISAAGWWRPRFYYAARAGAVVLCGENDAARSWLSSPYNVGGKGIEGLSAKQRAAVADEQAEWFFRYAWSEEQLRDEMQAMIRRR